MKADNKKLPAASTGKKTGVVRVSGSGRKGKSGEPPKRKKRKKPTARKTKTRKANTLDGLQAVLVAALIILTAAVASLTGIYLHSVKNRAEAAAQSESASPVESGKSYYQPLLRRNQSSGFAERRGQELNQAAGEASGKTGTPETTGVDIASSPPVEKEAAPAALPPAPRVLPPVKVAPPASQTKNPPLVKSQPPKSPPAAVKAPEKEPEPMRHAPAAGKTAVSLTTAGGVSAVSPPLNRGRLVFVIDDAGHNLRDLEPFLKFPGALTIAVLPGLPYSAEAARRIRAAGKEVFLHQPMEPMGGQNPGPGAIRSGMGREEIRAIISRNLAEVGPVAGINNHEGSRISTDEEAMETVISLCEEKGIMYLDSRTTAETAAPRAARRLGVVIGERDVFVDNERDRDSMTGYINTGLSKAEEKGRAIMIGHVWSPDLAPLLSELYPDLRKRGFTFFAASKVFN